MKISRIIIILFIIILASCNVVQEEKMNTLLSDNDVIVISDSLSTYPIKNYISRYNDGNLEQLTSFETKSDVGYHYAVDTGVYFFNSGLYYVDFQSKIEVEKLSDLNITDFCKDNDDIYYYENIGFNEQGYQGNIYKNDKLILNLAYFVRDMIFYKGKLYMIGSYYQFGEDIFLLCYDGNSLQVYDDSCIKGEFAIVNDSLTILGRYQYAIINESNIEIVSHSYQFDNICVMNNNENTYVAGYSFNRGYVFELTLNERMKFNKIQEMNYPNHCIQWYGVSKSRNTCVFQTYK